MFHSARLKLTCWYVLFVMLVSGVFSLAIYTAITRELERGFRRAEMHLGRFSEIPMRVNPRLFEDLTEAKARVTANLIVIDGLIIGLSAIAGYFLAGQTLVPIKTALEEQKRFVADASHEFRTPLTSLQTAIEVALRQKQLTVAQARSVLKSNLEDISGLASLTDHLLSLARYQAGNGSLRLQSVKISQAINSAYRKILPLARKKQIKITLNITDAEIRANQPGLEEMILIFLDNAVKYTPKAGEVTVSAHPNNRRLVVKIADTGIGISAADIPHIFDRFYRADVSRTKDDISGFGLGLSLAKKIIDIHHGSVAVKSAVGKGTTFTVKLPLKPS